MEKNIKNVTGYGFDKPIKIENNSVKLDDLIEGMNVKGLKVVLEILIEREEYEKAEKIKNAINLKNKSDV